MSNIPNIRQLPLSLKLNTNSKYRPPIKTSGYVIDPTKFSKEIKEYEINLKEIKALLLMMVKGDANFISKLIKPMKNNYLDLMA